MLSLRGCSRDNNQFVGNVVNFPHSRRKERNFRKFPKRNGSRIDRSSDANHTIEAIHPSHYQSHPSLPPYYSNLISSRSHLHFGTSRLKNHLARRVVGSFFCLLVGFLSFFHRSTTTDQRRSTNYQSSWVNDPRRRPPSLHPLHNNNKPRSISQVPASRRKEETKKKPNWTRNTNPCTCCTNKVPKQSFNGERTHIIVKMATISHQPAKVATVLSCPMTTPPCAKSSLTFWAVWPTMVLSCRSQYRGT